MTTLSLWPFLCVATIVMPLKMVLLCYLCERKMLLTSVFEAFERGDLIEKFSKAPLLFNPFFISGLCCSFDSLISSRLSPVSKFGLSPKLTLPLIKVLSQAKLLS